jgi:hypothetical protein
MPHSSAHTSNTEIEAKQNNKCRITFEETIRHLRMKKESDVPLNV